MIAGGAFRTDNLAEAAVLSMHGMTPAFERIDGGRGGKPQCVFIFTLGEEDPEWLEELVGDIRAGRCRVEPVRYVRELGAVRSSMYRFLDVDRTALRLGRPATS